MAATETFSLASTTGIIKQNVGAPTVVFGRFTNTTTDYTAATTTEVLLCKIPNRTTVTDLYISLSSASTAAPYDAGVDGDTDAFVTAAAKAVRASTTGFPYDISVSDSAANQFRYLTAVVTPGSTTAGMAIEFAVTYVAD